MSTSRESLPRRAFCLVTLLAALAIAAPVRSQAPAASSSAQATISVERLARLDAFIERHVNERRIAGGVMLVAQHGRIVHLRSFGKLDVDRGVPMSDTALFRIASMTKAITSVAVMQLVEDGSLLLSDPVAKYLPAFTNTTVAVLPTSGSSGGMSTVPARRPITIRHLLTHTAGISYGTGPLEAQYKAAGVFGWYCADRDETMGAMVDRLAALPFEAHPGERWVYGFGTDILGRVVEVVSGLSLDEYFRRHIFEPLKMRDTFFFVPPEKSARLATVYSAQADGTIARAPEQGSAGQGAYVVGPRKCFSGGAGLVSTITDYARFLQMLLDGGSLDGARVLSPASVASMTSNHVGSLYSDGDLGFGLGFEVVDHLGRAGRLGAVGEFNWGSAYYPRYWVDPAHGVVAIFMTQLIPAGGLDLSARIKSLVYQAIETQRF